MNLADAGGTTEILSAVKKHPNNACVQEYGCPALCTLLADKNEENKATIAEEESISVTLSVMKKHPNNANVQEYGCAAIGTLADNIEENKVLIANAD